MMRDFWFENFKNKEEIKNDIFIGRLEIYLRENLKIKEEEIPNLFEIEIEIESKFDRNRNGCISVKG